MPPPVWPDLANLSQEPCGSLLPAGTGYSLALECRSTQIGTGTSPSQLRGRHARSHRHCERTRAGRASLLKLAGGAESIRISASSYVLRCGRELDGLRFAGTSMRCIRPMGA